MGFKPLTADHSVFIRGNIIIVIYVDGLLLVGPDLDDLNSAKKELSKSFQMSDLGASTFDLGMSVTRDREAQGLSLSQETYIKKLLRTTGMQDSKPASTPMEANNRLEKAESGYEATPEFRTKYQSIVGSLMYALLGTWPDIAFAVPVVNRDGSNPTPAHYGAVERILRYLKGSSHLKLVYRGDLKPLTGYTDSAWAGDHDTRRSTSGYVFNVGSGAVSWSSKRQPTVALSTCEAEYGGQTQAAKEAVWLKGFLDQLELESTSSPQAVVIFGDNQSAIALANNPQFHARAKHISIQNHWIRERIDGKETALEYTPTEQQIADGLTKPLSKDRFLSFRAALGLEG